MNEKKTVIIIAVVVLCVIIASYSAGYAVGHKRLVQPAGLSNNEIRAELESKQRRISELEARSKNLGNLVSNAFRNVGGAVERAERRIEYAITEVDDIRETIGIIRAAVKDMENSLSYFRGLTAGFSDGELNFSK